MIKARIVEIFSSIQGEGLWVGRPQVFVRFHGCRLKCAYCDTPATHHQIHEARVEFPPFSGCFEKKGLEWTAEEITEAIGRFRISSVALTGGEPLEHADFIENWLSRMKNGFEVLLETNGIESESLKKVIDYVDMVSLDLKIPSATGEDHLWNRHEEFIKVAVEKPCYAKVVYDEKMTEEEKERVNDFIEAYPGMIFIFQPVSPLRMRNMPLCLDIFSHFARTHPQRVRLIPQVHKSLGIL